jgi:Ca2+-binding EF-hand superfamily protein
VYRPGAHACHTYVYADVPVLAHIRRRVEIKEPRLDLVFSFLDPDNHGKISADSIRSALGEDIAPQELEDMIKAGDRDGDGMVSKQ